MCGESPTARQLSLLKALAGSGGRLRRASGGSWVWAPLFGSVRMRPPDLDEIRAMEERGWLRRTHACSEESRDTRELTERGRTIVRTSRCG